MTSAVSATPRTTSASRTRSLRRPRAAAASSPSSSRPMRGASHTSGRARSAASTHAGTACAHVMPLSDPAPHTAAAIAVSRSALTMSHWLADASIADTAMPTMMRRNPCTPRR
ncbi:Uncharacterised protein [Mycobacteroides abscessus]|nr:Uncharacterised protein [Mycobacteroides abscessus]